MVCAFVGVKIQFQEFIISIFSTMNSAHTPNNTRTHIRTHSHTDSHIVLFSLSLTHCHTQQFSRRKGLDSLTHSLTFICFSAHTRTRATLTRR